MSRLTPFDAARVSPSRSVPPTFDEFRRLDDRVSRLSTLLDAVTFAHEKTSAEPPLMQAKVSALDDRVRALEGQVSKILSKVEELNDNLRSESRVVEMTRISARETEEATSQLLNRLVAAVERLESSEVRREEFSTKRIDAALDSFNRRISVALAQNDTKTSALEQLVAERESTMVKDRHDSTLMIRDAIAGLHKQVIMKLHAVSSETQQLCDRWEADRVATGSFLQECKTVCRELSTDIATTRSQVLSLDDRLNGVDARCSRQEDELRTQSRRITSAVRHLLVDGSHDRPSFTSHSMEAAHTGLSPVRQLDVNSNRETYAVLGLGVDEFLSDLEKYSKS